MLILFHFQCIPFFFSFRIELDNQPLLTKELRNRQMLQKLGRFKQTVIRVYFPEKLVLQAVFEAGETSNYI